MTHDDKRSRHALDNFILAFVGPELPPVALLSVVELGVDREDGFVVGVLPEDFNGQIVVVVSLGLPSAQLDGSNPREKTVLDFLVVLNGSNQCPSEVKSPSRCTCSQLLASSLPGGKRCALNAFDTGSVRVSGRSIEARDTFVQLNSCKSSEVLIANLRRQLR